MLSWFSLSSEGVNAKQSIKPGTIAELNWQKNIDNHSCSLSSSELSDMYKEPVTTEPIAKLTKKVASVTWYVWEY